VFGLCNPKGERRGLPRDHGQSGRPRDTNLAEFFEMVHMI